MAFSSRSSVHVRSIWKLLAASGLLKPNWSTPGQIPETLQDLDETPRVLVAIAEEVAPELRLGFRRQLLFLEQQPLELQAGRRAVADRQGVIAELRHQGRQDTLEAEAAAEIRVIDMIAHHGEQVHQPIRDP